MNALEHYHNKAMCGLTKKGGIAMVYSSNVRQLGTLRATAKYNNGKIYVRIGKRRRGKKNGIQNNSNLR